MSLLNDQNFGAIARKYHRIVDGWGLGMHLIWPVSSCLLCLCDALLLATDVINKANHDIYLQVIGRKIQMNLIETLIYITGLAATYLPQ